MQIFQENELKRITKYFFLTFIPLSVDFVLFSLLNNVFLNLPIFFSNLISSSTAFTISYNLDSKLVFKVRRSLKRFIIYIIYSFVSIYSFSFFISFLYTNQILFDYPKIVYKVSLLPLSFLTNYFFKRVLLQLKIKN